jgi:transcriptional regulator with XRE-family HTH domain
MAKLAPEQQELRLRLCAHLRRIYAEHKFKQRQEMAEKLGTNEGHFSALFNGKTVIGLDVAVKLHRVFGESLNFLCDDDPAEKYYPPGTHPGLFFAKNQLPVAAETTPRYPASPSPAQPEKHTRGAGGGRRR